MFRKIFIISILLSNFSFGQNKTIVLKIDTLNTIPTANFEIVLFDGFKEYQTIKPTIIDTNINSISAEIYLKSDSSTIQLTLDDKDGYIELLNVYRLKTDTLQINRFDQIKTCYSDSIFEKCAEYYVDSDGEIGQPFKVTSTKKESKKECSNFYYKTSYTINGIKYDTSYQKHEMDGNEYQTYHGRTDKKLFRKAMYFHGVIVIVSYNNIITIKL